MARVLALSRDTSPEVRALLVERWRRMSIPEKARMIEAVSRDCETLARAGIRDLHPDAAPDEVRLLLGIRRFGRELAHRALRPSVEEG